MNARKQGTQLRRIVAQRLDTFFAAWLEQLGAGTTALWQRVEGRAERSAPSDDAPHEDAPGVMHVPMQQQAPQQQAMQQQQQKKKE